MQTRRTETRVLTHLLLLLSGSLDDPIIVKSFGDEQYLGCTGYPVDTHPVIWLTTSRDRPVERCPECGGVYKMEYVGPQDDGHGHGHDHGHRTRNTQNFCTSTH